MKKFFLLSLFILLACRKKQCFEVNEKQEAFYLEEIKSLFVYQYLSGIWLQDSSTGGHIFLAKTPEKFLYNTEEDECGNKRATYFYRTSFFQKPQGVRFYIQAEGKDQAGKYIFRLEISDSLNDVYQVVSYDLKNKKTFSDTTSVEELSDFSYDGKTYEKVLKIQFQGNLSAEAITRIYYAGYDGILRFEKKNGKVFR